MDLDESVDSTREMMAGRYEGDPTAKLPVEGRQEQ
jgi:hypothetical protein